MRLPLDRHILGDAYALKAGVGNCHLTDKGKEPHMQIVVMVASNVRSSA
jgi:hypothetical protein